MPMGNGELLRGRIIVFLARVMTLSYSFGHGSGYQELFLYLQIKVKIHIILTAYWYLVVILGNEGLDTESIYK